MKVINLTEKSRIYTSNSYFIRGDYNSLKDVNTLVDTGCDPDIFEILDSLDSGIGKKRLDQIILTHSHSDHSALVEQAVARYHPEVLAIEKILPEVTGILKHGEIIRAGDRDFEIIHFQGHSSDSIGLYCEAEEAFFSGDITLKIMPDSGVYDKQFVKAFKLICSRRVSVIYPGHGKPVTENCRELLWDSVKNLR